MLTRSAVSTEPLLLANTSVCSLNAPCSPVAFYFQRAPFAENVSLLCDNELAGFVVVVLQSSQVETIKPLGVRCAYGRANQIQDVPWALRLHA